MVRLLICGGGNGAHVYAGIASSQPDVDARVLTLYADEAERWTQAMKEASFEISVHDGAKNELLKSKPSLVTKDPKLAMEEVDIIVFMVPAFAHVQYLNALEPYLKDGQILVGLPGQAGFEFAVYGILGKKAQSLIVMNFESLPWACRINEFGRNATVLGTKEVLLGAMHASQHQPKTDPLKVLHSTVGQHPEFKLQGHLLGITMMSPNGYLHPTILYGQWHDWDGTPVDQPPLFYNGISENTANLLAAVSNKLVSAAKKAMAHRPGVDLSTMTPMVDWYHRCYDNDIKDKTNLYTCIKTNKAYDGLTHPCVKRDDGKFVPNYKYRYLAEDIPYGLTVARDIAHILGVPTPSIDKVLTWAQGAMGKEYLVDGALKGKDVKECRVPSVFGFNTPDALLDL